MTTLAISISSLDPVESLRRISMSNSRPMLSQENRL